MEQMICHTLIRSSSEMAQFCLYYDDTQYPIKEGERIGAAATVESGLPYVTLSSSYVRRSHMNWEKRDNVHLQPIILALIRSLCTTPLSSADVSYDWTQVRFQHETCRHAEVVRPIIGAVI